MHSGAMRKPTLAISAVAVVLGLGGGASAYTLVAAPASTPDQVTVATMVQEPSAAASPEEPEVKFRPCVAPAHREGKICVEDIIETVVLPSRTDDSQVRRHGEDSDNDKREPEGDRHSGAKQDDDDDDHDGEDQEDHEDDEDHEDGEDVVGDEPDDD